MGKIEDIQRSIEQLSAEDIARLRDRFDELDGRLLDEKIARDAKAGKFDNLIADVKNNIKAGRGEVF